MKLQMSPLVLGVADFGSSIDIVKSFSLMDEFYKSGCNSFDTAHVYAAWLPDGVGKSEITLGQWVKKHNIRKDVKIVTKGAHPPLGNMKVSRMSNADITSDLSESLDRLQMDYVDYYLLHRDAPEIPAIEIINTLEEKRKAGLIRHYGCSNWQPLRVEEAIKAAKEINAEGFVLNQIYMNMAVNNNIGDPTLAQLNEKSRDWYIQNNFPVMAYSSQATGWFNGKYYRGAQYSEGKESRMMQSFGNDINFQILEYVKLLSDKYSVSMNQIALTALMSENYPVYPVIGGKTIEQINDSIHALNIKLLPEETACLWSLKINGIK
ncbi:MAG: aldo/keto reductase [bacterium]